MPIAIIEITAYQEKRRLVGKFVIITNKNQEALNRTEIYLQRSIGVRTSVINHVCVVEDDIIRIHILMSILTSYQNQIFV